MQRDGRRWLLLAGLVWAVGLAVIAACAWVRPWSNTVYPIYARAGTAWRHGEPVYDRGGEPYRYSPLVTAGFALFSVVPDRLGGLWWRLVSAAVLLTGLAWWVHAGLPRSLTNRQRAVLFLLVLPPALSNLHNGQSNVLILGLLLLGMTAAATERWRLATVCLAAVCLFKVYPVAVGLLVAAAYPRRCAWLLAAMLVGLALPFLLQHPAYVAEQYAAWVRHMTSEDRTGVPLALWYRDLRLLCAVWLFPIDRSTYLAIQLLAAAGMAGLAVAWRRTGRAHRELLCGLFTLGCCWMTALGPAAESATYVLLAPALAWAVLQAWLERGWACRCVLAASYGLLLAAQVAAWFPGGRLLRTLGVQPLAALLLLAAVLAGEWVRVVSWLRERWRVRLEGERDLPCPGYAPLS